MLPMLRLPLRTLAMATMVLPALPTEETGIILNVVFLTLSAAMLGEGDQLRSATPMELKTVLRFIFFSRACFIFAPNTTPLVESLTC